MMATISTKKQPEHQDLVDVLLLPLYNDNVNLLINYPKTMFHEGCYLGIV
jgi:hypothetical protein